MPLKCSYFLNLLLAASCISPALAAEDFRVRYNVAGTLGGDIFAPQNVSGWIGAVAYTYIDGRKLTGDDGRNLSLTTPAGTVPLPAPAPTALYPAYAVNQVALRTSGHANVAALALGYITEELYGGGQIIVGALLPIAQSASDVLVITASPTLNWPHPAQPNDATKAVVQSGFDSAYQSDLATQAAAESGHITGIGDMELAAGWMLQEGPWKFRAGAALVLPTGRYSATSRPNIGFGNYYTLRPEFQATYLPSAKIALSGKLILGFNTRNNDKQLKSGDWFGLEAAAGYMTPLGPVGLHGVHVRQYQDDENNLMFGSSRLLLNGLGVFFTTKLPVIDTIVTLQYMVTTSSRNARHSNFSQLRIVQQF
ncbi:MAG: transporter [Rhodoferax sp.]|nr:transporter [Rhodoferax sp.]